MKINKNWQLKIPQRFISLAALCLAIAALGTAWAFTLLDKPLDTKDPVLVAQQFIVEIQANHPHKAYLLTSSNYQKNVKESDFNKNVVPDSLKQLPQTKPQFFAKVKALPPNDKRLLRVVFNLPSDGQAKNHKADVTLAKEADRWYVEAMSSSVGLVKRPAK